MRKLRCRAEIDRQVLGAVPAPLATAAFSLLLDIRLLLLDVASVHVAVVSYFSNAHVRDFLPSTVRVDPVCDPISIVPKHCMCSNRSGRQEVSGKEVEEEREDAEADVEEEEEGEAWWWW